MASIVKILFNGQDLLWFASNEQFCSEFSAEETLAYASKSPSGLIEVEETFLL